MEEPLRKTLRDESPYVRKTAALCVAKLYDLNPTMCLENGFLETLQEMIGDPNPMVVANCVTALVEIKETSPETNAFVITPTTLKKMLMALNECTEWGRVTILTTLADYKATDTKEAEHICERVSPHSSTSTPAWFWRLSRSSSCICDILHRSWRSHIRRRWHHPLVLQPFCHLTLFLTDLP
jgi:AP-1 complex subunit beta-1